MIEARNAPEHPARATAVALRRLVLGLCLLFLVGQSLLAAAAAPQGRIDAPALSTHSLPLCDGQSGDPAPSGPNHANCCLACEALLFDGPPPAAAGSTPFFSNRHLATRRGAGAADAVRPPGWRRSRAPQAPPAFS